MQSMSGTVYRMLSLGLYAQCKTLMLYNMGSSGIHCEMTRTIVRAFANLVSQKLYYFWL